MPGPGWFDLRQRGLQSGELVYSLDQGVAAKASYASELNPEANVAAGYCLGLAVQWIVLRLQGKDYQYSPNRALSPFYTKVAANDHAAFSKIFTAGAKQSGGLFGKSTQEVEVEAFNVALKPYGLKQWGSYAHKVGGPDADFILNSARAQRGLAVIVWRGEKIAHATAIDARVTEEKFNYFDANYGHYALMGVPRFIAWFNDYLARTQYRQAFDKNQTYYVLGIA